MKNDVRNFKTMRRYMRISFSQLLLSLFFFGVSSAHDGYAQELLNKRISLKVENQSIKKVLSSLCNAREDLENLTDLKGYWSHEAERINARVYQVAAIEYLIPALEKGTILQKKAFAELLASHTSESLRALKRKYKL